ncbi:MAG: hypothetical protein KAU16_03425 [Methanophagales archaeon]|nr:hypothetical protein [Methanophagales archaeon]
MKTAEVLQLIEEAARKKQVNLSYNQLTSFSAEIVELTNLTELYPYGNKQTESAAWEG